MNSRVPLLEAKAIEHGLDIIKSYYLVNRKLSQQEKAESINVMRNHFGFNDENMTLFSEGMEKMGMADESMPAALLGALLILCSYTFYE